MPTSDVKSSANAASSELAREESRAASAIVADALSKIYASLEEVKARARAAQNDIVTVGEGLLDQGETVSVKEPLAESQPADLLGHATKDEVVEIANHWSDAIKTVADRGHEMSPKEKQDALTTINQAQEKLSDANLFLAVTNTTLERNGFHNRARHGSERGGVWVTQSVNGRSQSVMSDVDIQGDIQVGDITQTQSADGKTMTQRVGPITRRATPTEQQSEVITVAETVTDSGPAQSQQISSAQPSGPEPHGTSAEPQKTDAVPITISPQSTAPKTYHAEDFIITKLADTTTIQDHKGKILFEYSRDDDGSVRVTTDKITNNTDIRTKFTHAAASLKSEAPETILADPTGRSQVQKLGGLAPAGSHAIAVASYVATDKQPVVTTDKYEFRKVGEGFGVHRHGEGGKPKDSMVAQAYSNGQIISSQQPDDLIYMKSNYATIKESEKQYRQQVQANQVKSTTARPVSRVTAQQQGGRER